MRLLAPGHPETPPRRSSPSTPLPPPAPPSPHIGVRGLRPPASVPHGSPAPRPPAFPAHRGDGGRSRSPARRVVRPRGREGDPRPGGRRGLRGVAPAGGAPTDSAG